jgi:lipopolysaccharide biosynthesis protein
MPKLKIISEKSLERKSRQILGIFMNKTELELLQKSITNFKCKEYDESQFHSTFETVIGMITESHNYEIRRLFESIESSLEISDFMSNNKREDYLVAIERIERILRDNELNIEDK